MYLIGDPVTLTAGVGDREREREREGEQPGAPLGFETPPE